MKNFYQIELDARTYKRLRRYCGAHGLTVNDGINELLNLVGFKFFEPSKALHEYTKTVVKIGKEQGEEAAMQFIKEHPYVETGHE